MKLKISLTTLTVLTLILACQSSLALTCLELDGAYLYSQESEPEYLGFIGASSANDSINNRVGLYGASNSALSVRNPLSSYGSSSSQYKYSANNSNTATPPQIYKNQRVIGLLSSNTNLQSAVSLESVDACAFFSSTSPNDQPLSTFTLTVTTTGDGVGTVASSPEGISCGNSCQASFDVDTIVQMNAFGSPGSVFTGWSGACTGIEICRVTMDDDKNLVANFTLGDPVPTFLLSVEKSGTGSGTVTSEPEGIDCGTDCDEIYEEETSVTLTAIADEDSKFIGWSGPCSGTEVCEVVMDSYKPASATFDKKTEPGFSSQYLLLLNKDRK